MPWCSLTPNLIVLLQVYNGHVYDLLSPPHESQKRPLKVLASATPATTTDSTEEDTEGNSDTITTIAAGKKRLSSLASRDNGSGSCVVGLSAHKVDNPEQVMELLRQGARNRRVRSTEVNPSHCCVFPDHEAKRHHSLKRKQEITYGFILTCMSCLGSCTTVVSSVILTSGSALTARSEMFLMCDDETTSIAVYMHTSNPTFSCVTTPGDDS